VGALSTYQGQVQDLIRDPNAQVWPLANLTNYINEARNKIAQDTKCLRQLLTADQYPSLQVVLNQEIIVPQTTLPAPFNTTLIDTLNITALINNQRVALIYKPFTWLNAFARGWKGYTSYPKYWTRVSPIQYVIAPVANATYPLEWDGAFQPPALIDDTTVETLVPPFQEPVQYYAAYKAKIRQQSYQEAQGFLAQYKQSRNDNVVAYWGRIVNPYG
jgi:hypothetical protein